MPFEVHEIFYFLSKSNFFNDNKKFKIISKIAKAQKGELIRGIQEYDFDGIDGITELLDSVSKSAKQEILKLLRDMYKPIPLKFLERLKQI